MPTPTSFQGQTAIVTGGASGLGLSITRRLQSAGVFVAVLDLDPKLFPSLEKEFGAKGACLTADVTDEASVKTAVAEVMKRRGRIEILVNSAGVTGITNTKTQDVPAADFDFVYRVNLRGPFLMAREVLPIMVKQAYGRILHIASIAGKEGNPGMVAYSATKAGVIGMTKSQGKEYAETGVTINALAPAVIRTPMVEKVPEAQIKYMTDRIPMKRCGTLDEIAAMAAFIVSPENSFTTAFTFDISGGRAVY